MMNVFVDRKVLCIPICALPLFVDVETSITGTLIKYRDIRGGTNVAPTDAAELPQPLESDAPEITYGKLLENFARGRERGEEFHTSLPAKNKAELKDYVIRQKGNGSGWNWKLRFESAMTATEREMLEWYVKSFTDYSPKFDR